MSEHITEAGLRAALEHPRTEIERALAEEVQALRAATGGGVSGKSSGAGSHPAGATEPPAPVLAPLSKQEREARRPIPPAIAANAQHERLDQPAPILKAEREVIAAAMAEIGRVSDRLSQARSRLRAAREGK